jgi:hypothetical protein
VGSGPDGSELIASGPAAGRTGSNSGPLAVGRVEAFRSFARAEELGRQAVELAERHGWTDDPAAGAAYVALASGLVWQGCPREAEGWVQHAERTGRPEADPAANPDLHLSTFSVRTGDRLLFFTDGLLEARDRAGRFFRVDQQIQALSRPDLQAAADELLDRLRAHTRRRLDDDVAVLLAELTLTDPAVPPAASAQRPAGATVRAA